MGVLALGPDTLIIRLLELDTWTVLFWRGLLLALGIVLVLIFRYRRQSTRVIKKSGRLGVIMALMFTASTISFITALSYTSVAHVLIIISASPVFAAILSRLFLGEPIKVRTIMMIIIVMSAISLIVIGDNEQQSSLFGDALATLTSIFIAGTLVITRQARKFDMTPAVALSGLITALLALPLASPAMINTHSLMLLIILSLLLTFSFTMLMLGPRYIPAPEVSLMMPIETVSGIALVWWLLGEVPSNQSLIGGTMVIGCLMINSILLLKSNPEVS